MPRKIIEIEDIESEPTLEEVIKPTKELTAEQKKTRLLNLARGREKKLINDRANREAFSKKLKNQKLQIDKKEELKPISEDKPDIPDKPDENFDIRGMIRDVVRSELLDRMPPQQPLFLPSKTRTKGRRHRAPTYTNLSTDTESNIETVPVRSKRLHNKPLPPQVAVPQLKVELPAPLLKKPEYNIMKDLFDISS